MLTKNIASEMVEQHPVQWHGSATIATATDLAPCVVLSPMGSRHPFDQFILAKTPARWLGWRQRIWVGLAVLALQCSDFVNGQILYG